MYRISLLPEKYRLEREKAAQRLDLIIYFLFFTVICVILLSLATFVRLSREADLKAINIEVANLQMELNSLSDYAQKKDHVEQVYSNVSTLAKGLPSFPRVLQEILNTVPNNISIENVSLEFIEKTEKTSMEIRGEALDYADVSGWVKILDELEMTGDIYISRSTGTSDASVYNISFELSINILDASAADDINWELGE